MSPFRNREDAGLALAKAVKERDYADPVVLALPRGGVPLGAEVAKALDAPLDLIMVRKLGVTGYPELAAGAVVDGSQPEVVLNREVMDMYGMTQADIDDAAAQQLKEIDRRRTIYLGQKDPVSLSGKTAIVVDDGIATGATMKAALTALRRQKPARIVLAVPVAAADSLTAMKPLVDEAICLRTPTPFHAVGAHYVDFGQVSDDEVVETLARYDRAAGD